MPENFEERLENFFDRSEPPLTPGEIRTLRRMQDEYEKAEWLRRKLLIYVPRIVAVGAGIGGLWAWFGDHFQPK